MLCRCVSVCAWASRCERVRAHIYGLNMTRSGVNNIDLRCKLHIAECNECVTNAKWPQGEGLSGINCAPFVWFLRRRSIVNCGWAVCCYTDFVINYIPSENGTRNGICGAWTQFTWQSNTGKCCAGNFVWMHRCIEQKGIRCEGVQSNWLTFDAHLIH